MLNARKNPLLNDVIYRLLVRPGLRSGFARVNVRGDGRLADPNIPMIVYLNHSSWWDGYMAMLINESHLGRDAYVMVEDTQLSRYQFFRWVGAFSVNRTDGSSARATLQYAVDVLCSAPNRVLVIFPQGEILANDTRPLEFFAGVGHIVKGVTIRAGACALVPAALRYEFIGEQKPEAFASIGAARVVRDIPSAKALAAEMAAELTCTLDTLRDDVTGYRLQGFTAAMSGQWSINRLWDAIRGQSQISEVGRRPGSRQT
jgi:chlorobactene lauroyltransferase